MAGTIIAATGILSKIIEYLASRRLSSSLPFRSDCCDGALRLGFAWGCYTHEVPVLDYRNAGQDRRVLRVHGLKCSLVGIRSKHPAVEHAGELHVGSVLVTTGHEI